MDEEASNGGEVRFSSNKTSKTRTVPLQRRLVVQVVAHDGGGVVEQVGYLVVVFAVGDDLLEQIDVIPAAGLDQLLLHGGALCISPSPSRERFRKFPVIHSCRMVGWLL